TKEVGFISILKTKRIADGVVRIEFCSGEIALNYLRKSEEILKETCKLLDCKEADVVEAVEKLFKSWKQKRKELKRLAKK
ncbi:MAG: hypothetical protein DRP00_02495, partial [Candidatus Aenigmatarchaeota archaeon]